MKWILILIVVIMIIACAISEQIKEKYNFYLNLKVFLQKFKLNVSFRREKVIDFLNNIPAKRQFTIFIKQYKNFIKTNEFSLQEIKILEEDEKRELENIVKAIGGLDVKNEIEQLDSFLIDVETKLNKAQQDKLKLCPMIIKLSLLFAMGVAILFI